MRKKSQGKMKSRDKSYSNFFSNIRKAEKESNVRTSTRITMLPKFLTLNVISETARKNDSGSGSSFKKQEDTYDIFEQEPSSNLRRSARITNKKSRKDVDSFNKPIIDNNSIPNYHEEKSFYETPPEMPRDESKRKCKSLFREINRRYAELVNEESDNIGRFDNDTCNDLFIEHLSQNTCSTLNNCFNGDLALWNVKTKPKIEPPTFFDDMNTQNSIFQNNIQPQRPFCPKKLRKYDVNADFFIRLSNQLLDDVEELKEQALDECKSKINIKIHCINFTLQQIGSKLSHWIIKQPQTQYVEENESDPIDFKFDPLPHTNWVFQTPNKQRMVKQKTPKRSIKPAFVYKNKNNHITNIVELNHEDITIDLTKFKFQEYSSHNVPTYSEPFGCFNQVPASFNTRQNNFFDVSQPSASTATYDFFSSQQSNIKSQRSGSFEFRPNLPGGSFFL